MNEHLHRDVSVYVGLDVHKDCIYIAVAEAGRDGEVRHLGTVSGGTQPVSKALRRLVSAGHVPHIVYEAGPRGFVLQRHLSGLGYRCDLVAPSSIPKRSGDRVKTDRRDALLLARLARAGELSAVRVPDAADDALRDVVRAREDAVREQRNARHRLKALLLRNGVLYAGRTAWTAAHQRWLATLKLPHAAQQIAFQEYLHALSDAAARAARLDQSLREALPGWSLAPVVSALQALRGIQLIAAITLVAEIQELHRFTNPRQLMATLGLVPPEDSSAARRRLGSITKAGNRAARRLLIEAAHHYRHPARLTAVIARRQADLPGAVIDIAWRAQLRLCARFQRPPARRAPHNKIVVAVARELAGFVWAIARA